MKELPSHDATGLALWHRCPRRFWFERVQRAVPDHALTGFAGPLGVAGHAGIGLALKSPGTSDEALRERMLAAFDEELRRGQAGGRSYDPDTVGGALDRLETEYLDLVLRLRADERVRKVAWSEVEQRFEWLDRSGRRFTARINAVGRVLEPLPAFGRRGWDPITLLPGTWIVVDWRFGKRHDLSPTGLALNLQLAVWLRGLEWRAATPFRAFVGAVRDLVPPRVVRDPGGALVKRTLEELNPDYVRALADGRPVDARLVAEAERSRRRFVVDGQPLHKRVRRPNPRWVERAKEPRGPLFHEAEIAWPVVCPAIERTVEEIEVAGAAGGREEQYPARGPETQACFACPFRGQCLPREQASGAMNGVTEVGYEPVGV